MLWAASTLNLPHRRLRSTASFLAGYILSAKKIPLDAAGAFNFTFEFGAGLEYSSPNPAPSASDIKISTSQTHTVPWRIQESITDSSN
jgi:hypothetical protein